MLKIVVVLLSLFYANFVFADEELERAVGQMMLVGFYGAEVNDDSPIVHEIKRHHIGGVMLFGRQKLPSGEFTTNIENPEQLKKLTQKLQYYAKKYNNYPLFIAVDQEGGLFNRLVPSLGFNTKNDPSEFALGKTHDQKKIYDVTFQRAELLKRFAINLDFAPVADLNINPDNPAIGKLERSFGVNPDEVTKDLKSAIKAYKKGDILCTLKHFPGLGSASANTDFNSADVTKTWSPIELLPYKNLIQSNGVCPFIMSAHIINRKLDESGVPASLSKAVVTDLLVKKLHYKGLVITDDMDAAAIRDHYPLEIAFEKAVLAGNNIILMHTGTSTCDPTSDAEMLFNTLLILAQNNPDIRQHVLDSYKKIMAVKKLTK